MGGKFNAKLKVGPGWIFPKTEKDRVLKFVNEGVLIVNNGNTITEENILKNKLIIENKNIEFGKYKGEAYINILTKDKNYLEWLLTQEWFKDKNYVEKIINLK